MGFNDFLKKAKETASSVADSAKAAGESAKKKLDEGKEQRAAQKAEQEKVRAEQQAAANEGTQKLLETIIGDDSELFGIDKKQLSDFTAEFYDKLYLPAHSSSASRLTYHPLDKKIAKYAEKDFADYNAAEMPLFALTGDNNQKVILTAENLYFKKPFAADNPFAITGKIPVNKIKSLTYEVVGQSYIFSCNGIALLDSAKGFTLDTSAFAEYMRRIEARDFVITNEQIDATIKSKIGADILKIVREYIFEDELLLYFAWGADSITAKDFIVCSDKQMVMLDREAFGLTKNVKQFYYEDVTSMATVQETSGLLDLALTVAMSLCDLDITVAGAKTRISCLFTYEAEKVIKVYRVCRKELKEQASKQQVIVQQAAEPQVDVIEQIEKLNKLKEAGIITEDEFNTKKAALLEKL